MKTQRLGTKGPEMSTIGLALMGMSEFYGPAEDSRSIAVIHRALELGINFLDTADVYGSGTNEELVGRALKGRRDRAVLATKFGNVGGSDGSWLGVHPRRPQAAGDRAARRPSRHTLSRREYGSGRALIDVRAPTHAVSSASSAA